MSLPPPPPQLSRSQSQPGHRCTSNQPQLPLYLVSLKLPSSDPVSHCAHTVNVIARTEIWDAEEMVFGKTEGAREGGGGAMRITFLDRFSVICLDSTA